MHILALTLDLDDTLWPVLPALQRADEAVDAWLRQHHPDVALKWPIDAMRALRLQVAAERTDLAHDFTTQRQLTLQQAFDACGVIEAPVDALWEIYFAARNAVELYADSLPALIGTISENTAAIGDTMARFSVTSAALEDFSRTTGDDLNSLVHNTDVLMTSLSQMGDNLGQTLDALHQMAPRVNASFQGETLAVAATVSYLSIGALSDPSGSRWPLSDQTGTQWPHPYDVNAFIGSLIDVQAEAQRLQKGRAKVTEEIARLHKKLGNERFVANAPEDVVAAEREKLAEYEEAQRVLALALERLRQAN